MKDFQLNLGDRINLRLMSAADHQYHVVPFTLHRCRAGIPDRAEGRFLVANAGYIAKPDRLATARRSCL